MTMKRRKRSVSLLTAVLLIAAALLILLFAAGLYLASYSMGIKRQTLEQARAWQAEHYDISWYDPLEKTDYTVAGDDGYLLHARFLKNPRGGDRGVILSHGYTDNRFGSLKYARFYLDLGFHVLLYDLRGHGENEPTFCTYSIRESRDLLTVLADGKKRFPFVSAWGLHGESLGAATTVACLKYQPDVRFAVADCGFSEITGVLENGMKSMGLPPVLVRLASLCAKIRYGYSFDEMRPIDGLRDNRVPVMFIHGTEDDFIPPSHSERMQAATRGYSELHLIPGAGHAASALTAPDDYRALLEAFLRKNGVLEE